MNGFDGKGGRDDTRGRSEAVKQRGTVRKVLEKAIQRAEERTVRADGARAPGSSSKADAAIQALREDRRVSREELDRPVTI